MKEKLWTKRYIVMLVLGTFTSSCFNMITPVLASFAVETGATLAVAGTIVGLFSVTALFIRPISGICADRINRGRLLLFSTMLIFIAALMYCFATSLPLLIFTRIVHGAAFAFSGTVTVAIIASITPYSRLGEGIGYHGLGHITATAIGPNLGIIIADRYGYRMVFLTSACLLFAAVVVILLFLDTPPLIKNAEKKPLALSELVSAKILPLALIGGIFSFLNGIISAFLVGLSAERQIANIGVYFTINAVCLLLIRPFAGRIFDKKGLSFILYPSLVLAAAAALLLGIAGTLGVVIIAAVLKAAGQGAGQPAIQAACIKKLPPEKSGLAASTFYIGADIGQGLGPLLGGAGAGVWGYNAMFFGCAGLFVFGMAVYKIYTLHTR